MASKHKDCCDCCAHCPPDIAERCEFIAQTDDDAKAPICQACLRRITTARSSPGTIGRIIAAAKVRLEIMRHLGAPQEAIRSQELSLLRWQQALGLLQERN